MGRGGREWFVQRPIGFSTIVKSKRNARQGMAWHGIAWHGLSRSDNTGVWMEHTYEYEYECECDYGDEHKREA
jgi:hypothetical protein